MSRRFKIIIFSLIFGAGGILFFGLFTSPVRNFLGVPVKTAVGIERMTIGKTEEEMDVERLTFCGNPVVYDEKSETIFLSVDMDTETWDGALSVEKGDLCFLKDPILKEGKKSLIIEEGTRLEVYCISEKTYSKVGVVLTGMPVINLDPWWEISSEHWGGAIQVYDPRQTGRECQGTVCDFYIRGNTAHHYDKKSYKLTLSDEKLSLCGMRKDDDWILNSLYDDTGLVRNRISYQIWNEMASDNSIAGDETVETAYVELFVDHEYMGIYLLSDRIDAKKTDIKEGDILYKQRLWPERYDNDGYAEAFKVVWPAEYDEEDITRMVDLMKLVYETERYPVSYEELENMLFMENAVDYNIFCQVLSAGDNLFKNTYLVAINQPDGSRKYCQIPWDTNGTFGIAGGRMGFLEERISQNQSMRSLIGKTLDEFDHERFYGLCRERWAELRQSVLSEQNLTELADENIRYIEKSGAYKRNLDRWPEYSFDEQNYKFRDLWKKDDLYRFIKERLKALDEYYGI